MSKITIEWSVNHDYAIEVTGAELRDALRGQDAIEDDETLTVELLHDAVEDTMEVEDVLATREKPTERTYAGDRRIETIHIDGRRVYQHGAGWAMPLPDEDLT